ncbi:hypothetical protein A2U01_0018295 [Trifolium medium]|uniref:Uncharacterized protein n=1 Tax=Trifolium medium TaxID=97028 RepID=A0A392NCR3_9FABA|nr:hypothetical protein [Trifolium medium]
MQAVSYVGGISRLLRSPIFLSLHRQISGLAQRNYSSDADNVEATPTEAVEDLYDKMLEYVKKALWKHTVYGLAPSVASAHHTLVLLHRLML